MATPRAYCNREFRARNPAEMKNEASHPSIKLVGSVAWKEEDQHESEYRWVRTIRVTVRFRFDEVPIDPRLIDS